MIEKNGFLKIYYDESETVEHETYKNLTKAEKDALNDTKDEIEEVEEEVFEDESAKEEYEKLIEQYEARGIDVSQIRNQILHYIIAKLKELKNQVK